MTPPLRPQWTLVCFPHAGGGLPAYRPWAALLGDQVELRTIVLPGRGSRWHEPPLTRMDDVVADAMAQLRPLPAGPFAFFGHSFGALVAYELCRRHFPEPATGPRLLFVSGRRPPHLRSRHEAAHSLPDKEFIGYLSTLGGMPPEVLADRELTDALLPAVRADIMINETHDPPRSLPLRVGVSALLGANDPLVSVADMLCWRDTTIGSFRLRVFPGGHFYLGAEPRPLLTAISEDLAGAQNWAVPGSVAL
jgi:surfactin synthase thioesterase subunit